MAGITPQSEYYGLPEREGSALPPSHVVADILRPTGIPSGTMNTRKLASDQCEYCGEHGHDYSVHPEALRDIAEYDKERHRQEFPFGDYTGAEEIYPSDDDHDGSYWPGPKRQGGQRTAGSDDDDDDWVNYDDEGNLIRYNPSEWNHVRNDPKKYNPQEDTLEGDLARRVFRMDRAHDAEDLTGYDADIDSPRWDDPIDWGGNIPSKPQRVIPPDWKVQEGYDDEDEALAPREARRYASDSRLCRQDNCPASTIGESGYCEKHDPKTPWGQSRHDWGKEVRSARGLGNPDAHNQRMLYGPGRDFGRDGGPSVPRDYWEDGPEGSEDGDEDSLFDAFEKYRDPKRYQASHPQDEFDLDEWDCPGCRQPAFGEECGECGTSFEEALAQERNLEEYREHHYGSYADDLYQKGLDDPNTRSRFENGHHDRRIPTPEVEKVKEPAARRFNPAKRRQVDEEWRSRQAAPKHVHQPGMTYHDMGYGRRPERQLSGPAEAEFELDHGSNVGYTHPESLGHGGRMTLTRGDLLDEDGNWQGFGGVSDEERKEW